MRNAAMRLLSSLMVVTLLNLGMVTSAQSVMIGTDQVAADPQVSAGQARDRMHAFLSRADVQDQLARLGVSAGEAQARVSAMTDEEVITAAGRLDRLPAGANGLGTLVGAAVLIFLVLLVTDILGFTKVFPFTKPIRR